MTSGVLEFTVAQRTSDDPAAAGGNHGRPAVRPVSRRPHGVDHVFGGGGLARRAGGAVCGY